MKAESDAGPGLARLKVEINNYNSENNVDIGFPKPSRGVKRRWQWIGGNMVIWPPFETASGTKVEGETDVSMTNV